MTLPGEANELTALLEAIELFDDHWRGVVSAQNTQIGVVRAAINSQHPYDSNELLIQIRAHRNSECVLLAELVRSRARALCRSSEINAPDNLSIREVFREISRFYAAEGEYSTSGKDHKFPSRGWTRGTPSGPTNVTVKFLKYDEDGFELNGGWPQTLRIRVDHPPGREETRLLFNGLRGDRAGIDFIEQLVEGRGMPNPLEVPVFDRYNTGATPVQSPLLTPADGAAAGDYVGVSDIAGWTLALASRWKVSSTTFVLRSLRSLRLDGTVSTTAADWYATQSLPVLDGNRPYLPLFIVEKDVFANGSTVRMRWGGQTFTKTGADMTGGGTTDFFVPTMDKTLWPKRFATNAPTIAFEPTVLDAADELYLKGCLLIPGTYYDGLDLWGFAYAGTSDPLHEAVGTMANTLTSEAIIPRVVNACSQILEGQPAYINETDGATTVADP